MKLKIPATVASAQDLTALLLEVREYAKWAAHEAIKKRVNASHKSDDYDLSPSAKELLRNWDSDDLDQLISTVEGYVSSAPTVNLTLAGMPPTSLKTQLVSWCRENISPEVLVAFRTNTTLLGGMVVRYGSRVFDWSFKRQIMESSGKFPEVLRRV